jgi:hypothetical protein
MLIDPICPLTLLPRFLSNERHRFGVGVEYAGQIAGVLDIESGLCGIFEVFHDRYISFVLSPV